MADRVFLVEDDPELRDLLTEVLGGQGYAVRAFANARGALRAVEDGDTPDLVVTDIMMPGMRGDELLRELRSTRPELNVIVITAFGSIDSAIALVKAGAYDYLTKPLGTADLLRTVDRGLAESRVWRETARRLETSGGTLPGFIGASGPMRELYQLIARAAHSRHPVIITGESGTGKELVARALHDTSGRGPFVAVNCGALPEALLESELFGHEKGAFTGADRTNPGLFEAAHTGTLFLDEIAELPVALQPKLLRALEQEETRRVGATEGRQLEVRIVAATNRDLDEEVRAGRFRDDLFWRLNVLPIHVPPLRDRPTDVPVLAEHFLRRALETAVGEGGSQRAPRKIAPETMAMLTAYRWPGNVRELRNMIERAATMTLTNELRAEDLPERVRGSGRTAAAVGDAAQRQLTLRELERMYVLEVLRDVRGNKTRAAEILGLDRKTLYRKLEDYRQDGLIEAD